MDQGDRKGRPYWSLEAFVDGVRQNHPDFQRPAGDYDSWYLREEASGEFLRGFKRWDAVDGALLRFVICGPLHWLGIVDLAAPEVGKQPSAFRFTAWASALLSGKAPGIGSRAGASPQVPKRDCARPAGAAPARHHACLCLEERCSLKGHQAIILPITPH
jgi:hypothetical protein